MDSPYIAQYKPTLFIGGFWLDDAKGIEFQISDPKEPLYGFRDVNFRSVARGQTLVHGILDLNFRFKGYLPLVLARLQQMNTNRGLQDLTAQLGAGVPSTIENPQSNFDLTTRHIIHREEQGNDFRNGAIDPRKISATQYKALLETPHLQFDIPKFTRLSNALKDTYWNDPEDIHTVSDRIIANGRRPRIGEWPSAQEIPRAFDITVVYQHPDPANIEDEQDEALVEVIRDVHIMSQSKIIMNAVPGGGDNIIERYQFIAKDVE